MAERAPEFLDDDVPSVVRGPRAARTPTPAATPRVREVTRTSPLARIFAGVDIYLVIVVFTLLSISMMMVYSTTFDWGFQEFNNRAFFLVRHAQTTAVGVVAMLIFSFVDYRLLRRFALPALLVVIGALTAVLLFGDDAFGARRGLIGGRFQPGEAAQLVTVIYMAAWLSAKRTKIRSVTYGLIPFSVLLGIVGGLVIAQPDLSTVAIIFITAGLMYFLAGANLWHLLFAGAGISAAGVAVVQVFSYTQDRIATYFSGIADLTQTNYHVQQAILAFIRGGWTGVGLGAGRQKFGYLPAPHTDSIFASIGEEMGVLGALFVLVLYGVFVYRGFRIATRSTDAFGALLAVGVTIWLVSQALLNIAVMTAVLPSTGVPLPLISYGGSSMTALLTGVGIMMSVSRVAARQRANPERRTEPRSERRDENRARHDRSRGNGGPRVPRPSRRGSRQHLSPGK
ncbi:MAG: putative peptidoglycan glycosyltransferase FtsW [Chloroflexota bacterium]